VEWTLNDYRPALFGGASWYESLQPPASQEYSTWYLTKAPLDRTFRAQMFNAGATFLDDHNLLDHYRKRFAGINAVDLRPDRAAKESRTVDSPITDIAHEFIIARYLERVLGWTFLEHEPPGRQRHRGEWLFRTPSGRAVFVEVKSISEPEFEGSEGAYMRGDFRPRIRQVVKDAYGQLPEDDRATLVVLAGDEILEVSHGILLGDIAQALFGRFQVRFNPLDSDLELRAGPSMRDRLVHPTKHRQLGCVAGFTVGGSGFPQPRFYAVDNPWAEPHRRVPDSDLANARRYTIDEAGMGQERQGLPIDESWLRMCEPPRRGRDEAS
jgi:hypothetical protein